MCPIVGLQRFSRSGESSQNGFEVIPSSPHSRSKVRLEHTCPRAYTMKFLAVSFFFFKKTSMFINEKKVEPTKVSKLANYLLKLSIFFRCSRILFRKRFDYEHAYVCTQVHMSYLGRHWVCRHLRKAFVMFLPLGIVYIYIYSFFNQFVFFVIDND
jgi:hypothetical protein